jgi:hypothetical protein
LVAGHHRTHSVPVKFGGGLAPINTTSTAPTTTISPSSSPFRFGMRTSPSLTDMKSPTNEVVNESKIADECRDELFAEAAKYHSVTGGDFILVMRQPGSDRIYTLCSDKFHDHKVPHRPFLISIIIDVGHLHM